MTTTIIAGVIFIVGLCIGIFIFLYMAYSKKSTTDAVSCGTDGTDEAPVKTGLTFEWKYITLPMIIFIISIIIAAMFFFQLPDQVAYRFTSGGAAESWMGKIPLTGILLGVQFVMIVMVTII